MKIDLSRFLTQGETEEVEFKESLPKGQEISKIVVGMANCGGGYILFGVNDHGKVVGVKGDLDDHQLTISAAIQSVSPAPLTSIQVQSSEEKSVLVLFIQRPADQVYYTFQGAIFVRLGTTTKQLEGQTHLEFLRKRHVLSFDELSDTDATLNDLDNEKIQR